MACLSFSGGIRAAVISNITADQPTKDGNVNITVKDTNSGLSVDFVAGILGTDTPAEKAAKINAAAVAAIAAAGDPVSSAFGSAAAGDTVAITKQGGGGMAVHITADTTGEANKLRVSPGGGNGQHWFWRFFRWLGTNSSLSFIIPDGQSYTFTTTNGASVFVTGDGITTAGQFQDLITSQFAAQGISFTYGIDPLTNQSYLASQYFEVGNVFPIAGVGVNTSSGYGDYLGGIGVEVQQVPEPTSMAIFGLGALGMAAYRARRKNKA